MFTEFPRSGRDGGNLSSITSGPDGNLWFIAWGHIIGRITPAGEITEFPIPSAGSAVTEITAGPDGNLWYTDFGANKIGRVTPAGAFTEFPLPSTLDRPNQIAAGPDGNLWFTTLSEHIGRITPAGEITAFPIPSAFAGGITGGPDGNVWFIAGGAAQHNRANHAGGGDYRISRAHPPACPTVCVTLLRRRTGTFGSRTASGKVGRITLPSFAEIAVYRQTTGEWFIRHNTGHMSTLAWGSPSHGDLPVPGDYDGDGRADLAVYRTSSAEWFIHRSSDRGLTQVTWGSANNGDRPVPGDYDADGKTDIAVYRPTTGEWFILRSSDGGLTRHEWGGPPALGDVPVPARYDGRPIRD